MSRIPTPNVSVNPNIDLIPAQAPFIEYQSGQYFPPNLVQYEQLTNVLQAGVQAAGSFLDFVKNNRELSNELKRREILKFQAGLAESKRKSAELSKAKMEAEYRPDGTRKSLGFVPGLVNSKGETVTEYSMTDERGISFPLINPYLTADEIDQVVRASEIGALPSEEIIRKSRQHAQDRLDSGQSPFSDTQYDSGIDPQEPVLSFLNRYDPDSTIDEIKIMIDGEMTDLIQGDVEAHAKRIEAIKKNTANVLAFSFATILREKIRDFYQLPQAQQQQMLDLGNDPDAILEYLKQQIPEDQLYRMTTVTELDEGELQNSLKDDVGLFMTQLDDIREKIRVEEANKKSSANKEIASDRVATRILTNSYGTPTSPGRWNVTNLNEFMENERFQFYAVENDLRRSIEEADAGWGDTVRRISVAVEAQGSIEQTEALLGWVEGQNRIRGESQQNMITSLKSAISSKTKAAIEDAFSIGSQQLDPMAIKATIDEIGANPAYARRLNPGDLEKLKAAGWEAVRRTHTERTKRLNDSDATAVLRTAESSVVGPGWIMSKVDEYKDNTLSERNTLKDANGNPILDASGKPIEAYTQRELLEEAGKFRTQLTEVSNSRDRLDTGARINSAKDEALGKIRASGKDTYWNGVVQDFNSSIRKGGVAPGSNEETAARNALDEQVQVYFKDRERDEAMKINGTSTLNPVPNDDPAAVAQKKKARQQLLLDRLKWDQSSGNTTTVSEFRRTLRGMFTIGRTEGVLTRETEDAFEMFMSSRENELDLDYVFGSTNEEKKERDSLMMAARLYQEGSTIQNAIADAGVVSRLSNLSDGLLIQQLSDQTPNAQGQTKQELVQLALREQQMTLVNEMNKARAEAGLAATNPVADSVPLVRWFFNQELGTALQKSEGAFQASLNTASIKVKEKIINIDGSYLPRKDFGNYTPDDVRRLAKYHSGGKDAAWVVTGTKRGPNGIEFVYALRELGEDVTVVDPSTATIAQQTTADWFTDKTYTAEEIFSEAACKAVNARKRKNK